MYIIASSTISHQPTFRNNGFSSKLSVLEQPSEILHPDYGTFIPKMYRRRMSDVLKMAVTCATDCIEKTSVKQPDAIIVGTSMGCNSFTKKFLDKIIASKGGLLSPTAFMLSTHNTIAGQISLLLGNHNYNMTHTQNSLSFEQALIDGMLCLKEGNNNVLVGAADEGEEELYNMNARLNTENIHSSCGASFFILSTEKKNGASPKLIDVESFSLLDAPAVIVNNFLNSNGFSTDDIDLIFYSNSNMGTLHQLHALFKKSRLFDYQKITGCYFTNAAFALNHGVDMLLYQETLPHDQKVKTILIYNNLIPENLGLVLLKMNNE